MPKAETRGVPMRIERATLAGEGLEQIPPWDNPPEGTHGHGISMPVREWMAVPFEGDLHVMVLEIKVGGLTKYQVINVGFDQFVYIIKGTMILTEENGEAHEYNTGDSLIMPKGFTGTREYRGDVFRELSVTEAKSFHGDVVDRIGVDLPSEEALLP